MKHTKLFYYGSGVFLFAMWWTMFGMITNWWIGLLTAVGLMGLQYITKRALNKVKIGHD